jgi:hypothetical protein
MKTLAIGILILSGLPLAAQSSQESAFNKLNFLLGKWTGVAGEKQTPQGAGQGAFSFEPELNGKIIVRRNIAEYDSGPRHEDLMVIYLDEPSDQPDNGPRAIYFDSEGHVIRYRLAFPSPEHAVFESDGTQPGPKYRLSYWMEKTSLNGTFEVAPPGSGFKPYMSWKSKKN